MGNGQKPEVVRVAGGQSERPMHTFRMPRDLVAHLKAEASRSRRDLTGHVIRWLEGIRTYFGLPEAAVSLLEADRERLGMERYEYLLHALYARSLALRENGAGFDAPAPHGERSPPRVTVVPGAQ